MVKFKKIQNSFFKLLLWLIIFSTIILMLSGSFTTQAAYTYTNNKYSTEHVDNRYSYTLGDIALAKLSAYGIAGTIYAEHPQDDSKEPISRLDAVLLIYETFAEDEFEDNAEIPFLDVPAVYEKAVDWAYENGITQGVSETEFGVWDITEGEFTALLLRAIEHNADFNYTNSVQIAKDLGIDPLGLSYSRSQNTFTLGDAALYLIEIIEQGDKYETQAKLPEDFEQLSFPGCIVLYPTSYEDAEAQIKEAFNYLPSSIDIHNTDAFPTEEYTLLYNLYENYKSIINNDSYKTEIWFIPYTQNKYYQLPLRTISSDTVISLYFKYSEAWELTCDLDDIFTIYVDDTISEICDKYYQNHIGNTEGKTEKKIVDAAINTIRSKASYDYSALKNGEVASIEDDCASMVGFMSDGKIVCAGYSQVLRYLLTRSGIECIEVIGSTTSETGKIDHSWNKVKIDDKWYNIDVCWADTTYPTNASAYLYKSDQEFKNLKHWAYTFTADAYKS